MFNSSNKIEMRYPTYDVTSGHTAAAAVATTCEPTWWKPLQLTSNNITN